MKASSSRWLTDVRRSSRRPVLRALPTNLWPWKCRVRKISKPSCSVQQQVWPEAAPFFSARQATRLPNARTGRRAMGFPVNSYVLCLVGAGLLTAVALPLWRSYCRRTGALLDDPGDRKLHAHPIPLAGGPAIWCSLAVSLIGAIVLTHLDWLDKEAASKIAFGVSRRWTQLGAIFLGATGMTILGVMDDKHDL